MDFVLNILTSLGINQTVFIQLAIFVITFIASYFIFIERIQRVIENRVDKIINVDREAEKRIQEAKKLQDKYNKEINDTNKMMQEEFRENKVAINKEGKAKLDIAQTETEAYLQEAQRENQEAMSKYKDKLKNEVNEISELLVNKIIK